MTVGYGGSDQYQFASFSFCLNCSVDTLDQRVLRRSPSSLLLFPERADLDNPSIRQFPDVGLEPWGPYFPVRHALNHQRCLQCGGKLEVAQAGGDMVTLFSRDFSNQVLTPTHVPNQIKEIVDAEALSVMDSMLAISHASVSSVGYRLILPAIIANGSSIASNVFLSVNPRIRNELLNQILVEFEIEDAEVVSSVRLASIGICDFEGLLRSIRRRRNYAPDYSITSLDLFDSLFPRDPDETWVFELPPVDAGTVIERIDLARQNESDFRIQNSGWQLTLIPGPERIHVFPREHLTVCPISTCSTHGQTVVSASLLAATVAKQMTELREFEELINDKGVTETAIQEFLENHSRILLGNEYRSLRRELTLRPTVITTGSDIGDLRPDFFLERVDRPLWDIFELKLPSAKLVKGQWKRRGFAGQLREALDQLREYYDFFLDAQNREWFRQRHGMQVYFPNLALVIGRSQDFQSPLERQRLERDLSVSGGRVRLYTYDDLLKLARYREFGLRYL